MIRLALRYFRTCRRLLPSQIGWRLRYLFRRHRIEHGGGSRIFNRLLEEYRAPLRPSPNPRARVLPGTRPYYAGPVGELLENRFTFLNETEALGAAVDWRRSSSARGTRLWKFTFDYHEYLVDAARAWRTEGRSAAWGAWFEAHLRNWMRQNPLGTPGYGRDNWNTYCLSMRVIAWMRVWSLVGDWFTEPFRDDFLAWLWVQCRFAADNIEYDILGNHIIKNWKALSFAAAFWDTPANAAQNPFRRQADALWLRYVRPQMDAAGQHEELSPMYGAIVLEDLLEGLAVGGGEGVRREQDLLRRMATWLEGLHFGETWAHFNDSADGMAPTPGQLAATYAAVLGEPWPTAYGAFATDAFAGVKNATSHWALACGPATHGPQPGHAHAAACSLEWAQNGRLVFANAGVFAYNPGERRMFARSAAAHNTASVAGHDFHEFWGAFRCARMGTCATTAWQVAGSPAADETTAEWSGRAVSCDGAYEHERTLRTSLAGFVCRDRVNVRAADAHGTATIRWRLAPGWRLLAAGTRWTVADEETDVVIAEISVTGARHAAVAPSVAYPAYGLEVPVGVLELTADSGASVETTVRFLDIINR